MKTTESEKLWSISIQDGRAKVFRNSIPLKSNHNGWEYGFLSSCANEAIIVKTPGMVVFCAALRDILVDCVRNRKKENRNYSVKLGKTPDCCKILTAQ